MSRLILAALLCSGCVGKKKYDSLYAEWEAEVLSHEGTRTDMSGLEKSSAATETELRDAITKLKAESAQLTKDLAARQAELAALRADQAALVKDRSRLKASIGEMEQALIDLAARKAAADKRLAAYQDLLNRFQKLIDAGKLRVKIVDGRMVVELATDILFQSGSAALSKEGTAALTEVAAVLADIPERAYQVEGHTDNDPIATKQYPSNWWLASARALTVTDTLIAAGLPADRVSAASFGEMHPAADNASPEGKASNRRIEIVVVPDLSDLPGFDELNALQD